MMRHLTEVSVKQDVCNTDFDARFAGEDATVVPLSAAGANIAACIQRGGVKIDAQRSTFVWRCMP